MSAVYQEKPDTLVVRDGDAAKLPLDAADTADTTSESPGRRTVIGSLRYHAKRIYRRTKVLLRPRKPVGPAPTIRHCLRTIMFSSVFNIMLLFIPVSWALHFAEKDKHTLIFIFSFLAIIPLAQLLAFATDELSKRVGQTLAGLLNATLGNAVELIVAIIALTKCQLRIVQSSLVGSVLSNLLLVLGMCFFVGGTQFSEQGFGQSSSQLNSSLLTISVIALLLPAAFHFTATSNVPQNEGKDILSLSHGVAIILLFIYFSYLFFQLYSHKDLYSDVGSDVQKSVKYAKHTKSKDDVAAAPAASSSQNGQADVEANAAEEMKEEVEVEIPELSIYAAISLLIVVTVFVAVTAEFLVDSINGLTESGRISKEFVGIILLPIVGNAAEHLTAVTSSVKDKLTLSLNVAVGSSIQIALFVVPLIVTLGWILNKPLTLLFDPYESIVLFFSVLIVSYTIQDGKSNWLEGAILTCLYIILAVTFWYYPGSDPSAAFAQCT